MKCVRCRARPEVYLRAHNAAFCRPCFVGWFQRQVERTIAAERMCTAGDRILVAVSGGKDSLALWDALVALGHRTTGFYLAQGIGGYSQRSREKVEAFALGRGLELRVHDLADEGLEVPGVAAATRRSPCSACGTLKRHFFDQAALEGRFDVLATGHNLDDEAAVLFGNTLSWASEYLLRQGPVLAASDGLARKVKPLCRFYEREMTAYCLLRGIEYIYEECPFAEGSQSIYYKELLNQLETTRPGAKLTFYLRFLEARKRGDLFLTENPGRALLHNCPRCGQPTSTADLCSFCRMIEKANPVSAG
jgi:uncharacterized protein (TIGR00269 family)